MHPHRRRNPSLAGRAGEAFLFGALAAAGIDAAAQPATAQSVELAWKLQAGTELVYRTEVRSETELPQGMGTSTMTVDTTQRWNVLEVDEDRNATVRLTTDRIRMSMSGPTGTMIVDSADGTGSGTPLGAAAAMAGTSYSVTIDPRGTLIGMSGVEAMQEALSARIPDPATRAVLDQMLSEEALRGQWEQGMLWLPAEAVGVGSTWDNTFALPLPAIGSITTATSNEVESIEGDLVVVGSSGTVSMEVGAVTASPIPMSFGDATLTGTTRFDTGRGLLLATEGTIALQMIMAMGGRETTMDMVTTVALELVEE